jgi:hypothetical protein
MIKIERVDGPRTGGAVLITGGTHEEIVAAAEMKRASIDFMRSPFVEMMTLPDDKPAARVSWYGLD